MNDKFVITPILKLCEVCNYHCDFCRYADNTDDNMMNLETCFHIVSSVLAWNREHGFDYIELNFHGGEPLLWGKKRFRELLEYEEKLQKQDPCLQIVNSIQTNGVLIDLEWMDIFRRGRFRIGLSIDGPENMNSHLDLNGKDIVQTGVVSLLNQYNVPFGVLSVISEKHFGKEQELYDFYKKNEIHNVGLCYCFGAGIEIDPERLSEFLIGFYRLAFYGSYEINVRELDAYIRKICGGNAPYCMFRNRKSCGHYLAFTGDEHVYFCDPEEKANSYIGNLKKQSLEEIISGKRYEQQLEKIRALILNTCCRCELLDICGRGCSRTDWDDKNAFCDMYRILVPQVREMIMSCMKKYPKTFLNLQKKNDSKGEHV